MTRETKIGLLVGLGFIIAFGLILDARTPNPTLLDEPEVALADPAEGANALTARAEEPARRRHIEPPVREVARVGAPARREIPQPRPSQPPRLPEVAPVQASPAPAPAAPQPQEPAPEPSPRGSVYVRYEEPVVRAQPPVVDIEAPAPDPAELAANRRAVRELRARAAGEIYTVQPGDSLRKIARRFYGDPGRFQEIFEANRDVLTDPATVRVGQRLRIPGDRSVVEVDEQGAREYLATLEASQRRPAPTAPAPARRSYTVQRGDNLWRIAQRQMNDGSAAAVQRLFEANRDKLTSPDTIVVGMELTIPE